MVYTLVSYREERRLRKPSWCWLGFVFDRHQGGGLMVDQKETEGNASTGREDRSVAMLKAEAVYMEYADLRRYAWL
ncbi:predicted protein [Plenodomus lingam JN3]|uniref:Predicted protein n=1 Tax=Leptosphaeria maculans (strain JN3 / isolate v23.1.3 / race Av1-4-5-6-7-8) TaxID=985895 RepID=E4ZNF9_LEPMJ|nr:predicted protein [Plenodomus lingam JN3]CBX93018.1 predicted protein [Plenodomus lingam JN3]